jgi:hypothetical protein
MVDDPLALWKALDSLRLYMLQSWVGTREDLVKVVAVQEIVARLFALPDGE